ncbi:MAG: UbiX family flavin prenyltransferase [Campylobacterota bacterium]|nr:UbiX family flavin prenyltransferase [Campylobacterota bacterium]
MKLIVAITGASGGTLAKRFLDHLPAHIDAHVVLSANAQQAYFLETNQMFDINAKNITLYEDKNIAAPLASGSFQADAMIILPCSMNTLAKCSIGMADTLITRAFTVMQKERKQTIICPREMPFSTLQLENMHKLSNLGVTIAPPVLGYYSQQQTLEQMENFLIGKLFDLLNIQNNLYKRWDGNNNE